MNDPTGRFGPIQTSPFTEPHLPMRTFITVCLTHSGQPRPYADHIYKGTIKIEIETRREWRPASHYGIPAELRPPDLNPTETFVHTELKPARFSIETIKARYAQLIHPFPETGNWYEPKLHSIVELSPGLWEVTITRAFTD